MKSVMSHQFSKVPSANIPRSTFDRSHGHKSTFNSGYLVPVYADEALPGDSFKLNMTAFGRLATPIVPYMDNVFLDTFFFAVPVRLIWDNWEKFNGAQINPGDSTDFLVPTMDAPVGGHLTDSLSDHFGIPTQIAGLTHNSLHHRAYNLIYNEWFRDQNLQDSVVVDTGDGPDTSTDYALLKRGKRHDYFTSCLPWPQKGDAVTLPLGGTADVTSTTTFPANANIIRNAATGALLPNTTLGAEAVTAFFESATLGTNAILDPNGSLVADLSTATAATINQLRQAFQIQKLYERDARGGTRYTEVIRSHFGVISPDSRLQRPEYLGGSSTAIHTHPVQQTSSTDATTPQGNLAAFATVTDTRAGFTKSFTEHCVLIGLVNVRADLNYQQGLDRMWSRQTRWDFYWPALAHIGEQAVLNKEIYAQNDANDDLVFGYQERFAEYRYKNSQICGQFRSNDANTIDFWHLAQNFASLPALNNTFIQESPPLDRVLAVTANAPQVLFDSYFKVRCARPMPVYSVPGLIDHF